MNDRTLDEQVAWLLGHRPCHTINQISGKIVWSDVWSDAQGAIYHTPDNGPLFFSAKGEHRTAPLVFAEVERRGKQEAYIEALLAQLDPEQNYSLYPSALETSRGITQVWPILWSLLTATPEQHCNALVAVFKK